MGSELAIRTLEQSSLEDIVSCLLDAFQNYFVKMPSELSYWEQRFKSARLNKSLSVGVFDDDRLIAFIVHGIDSLNGKSIAFNTGTGVIESYRGRSLVDKMYKFIIPQLKNSGIEECQLEVICENHRAIKVYKRIGFQIRQKLLSFKGTPSLEINHTSYTEISDHKAYFGHCPSNHILSWDFHKQALPLNPELSYYLIYDKHEKVLSGYVINLTSFQLFHYFYIEDNIEYLLNHLASYKKELKIVNVPDHMEEFIIALKNRGMENSINQYEMNMPI